MTASPTGPSAAPRPAKAPAKVPARTWTFEEALDGAFFVVAGALVLWLGWLLVAKDLVLSWRAVVSLVAFWALVAYIGLPRLQQVLTKIYVPDYFVGRTVTSTGILGDPVNLAANGTAAQIHAAMQRAGWTRADEVTLRSSWGIVVSAVLRRSYAAAPVSPLLLFGRHEAFAYEQEVAGNASQRHHVRFWHTPDRWVLPGGHPVEWLAAGTYDRKVGLSLFTLQVTHKIDADIDAERDHVVSTVCAGEPAAKVAVLANVFTAFRARNGGGDLVRTDGNLPVLDVRAVAAPAPPAVRPESEAPSRRRLPPPMLLATGVLSAGKATATLVGLVLLALGVSRSRLFPEATTGQLIEIGAGAAVLLALWAFTVARRRWARTLLMAVCSAEAVGQLLHLSAQDGGRVSLVVLLSAGVSVLILITVSSDDARRWVAGRDRPALPAR